jgi:hypothetical protein
MKKFYMTMVAMLCGVAAMAENYLYVNPITVDKGTATVEVPVCMKNSDEITAISFVLQLPEGLALAKNKKDKYYATVDEDRMDDHQVAFTDAAGGYQMISVYSLNVESFYENDGAIVYVPVAIANPDADATFEVTLKNISIATPAGVSVADTDVATFTLIVGEGTGINGINAADSKAPIYNVAGQRVSKAQKGVFIQNGKKVAVK